MFRFIHAADIHLDSPLRGLERYEGVPVEEIRRSTRRALENLVELAIEEHVDFVLIAGDLYDGNWPDYSTGLYLNAQMARLRDAHIPVFLIQGNHDAENLMTRDLRLPENVHKFSTLKPQTIPVKDCDVLVHGQGFATRAVRDNIAEGYPASDPGYFNIGILHTCATGREGHESYAPCSVENLLSKHYQYWCLGHIHKREILCEEPPIVFPGNIQGRHIRERGTKGCMLVTVDDARNVQTDYRSLDVLRWEPCHVDARGSADEDDLLQRVEQQLGDLFARTTTASWRSA